MINVTKTYLPDKKNIFLNIDKIYKSGWVTNNGPLVEELQVRLAEYLGVKNIICKHVLILNLNLDVYYNKIN